MSLARSFRKLAALQLALVTATSAAFLVWVGLAAAALTAVYIYFVYYTASLMTEPFYIVGILASMYLAMLLAEWTLFTQSTRAPPTRTKAKVS